MKLFVKNIGTLAGLNPDGLLKGKGQKCLYSFPFQMHGSLLLMAL